MAGKEEKVKMLMLTLVTGSEEKIFDYPRLSIIYAINSPEN